LFFSATMPPEIRRLADAFLRDPLEISVAPPASPAETVAQAVLPVAEEEKREALRQLIKQEDVKNALVFCNRKKDVGILYKSLQKHGYNVAALHGDLAQSIRTETLERFKRGEITLLVCSDVAARGLDIIDLSHVFNFDVPFHAEDYVHRIGRTGRAGKSGRAFTFATPAEGKALAAIEHLIGKAIPRIELAGLATADLTVDEDAPRGRGRARGGARSPRGGAARGPRAGAEPRSGARGGARRDRPAVTETHDETPNIAIAANDEAPIDNVIELIPEHRPEARPEARPVHEPRPRRDAERGDRGERGRSGRPRHHDDDLPAAPAAPMIGLGDHVPAFLLRPVKLPQTA
jgi:superfamily II DNA/RNA helicase